MNVNSVTKRKPAVHGWQDGESARGSLLSEPFALVQDHMALATCTQVPLGRALGQACLSKEIPGKDVASLWSQLPTGGLKALAVDDTRARFLAELQLHAGGKPPLGTAQAVVEGGPVNVLGALGEDDGRALEPQRLLPGLEVQLGLVVPPGAVGGGDDRLAVGGNGGDGTVEDVIPVVLLGVVFHLGVAPVKGSEKSGHANREGDGRKAGGTSLSSSGTQMLNPEPRKGSPAL